MENKRTTSIYINNVSKIFNLNNKKNESFLSNFLSLIFRKNLKRPFYVLDKISLEIYPGEVVGIIGKNGSGKSTLLRLISGIYKHNDGEIFINGGLIYINGFGFGLNERLTMKENIYFVGLIMGLSKKEIEKKFEEIVTFSGLEEFLNTKVYQFSSGMSNRLRFSITMHCLEYINPDIILLDEVFGGGGDLTFQNKALSKTEELIKSGATVILVSHDLDTIKKYCNSVVLLHGGKIFYKGDPENAVKNYVDLIEKTKLKK
jgi:ABC-type polysaccharide/polyol phosphate transport system ATPase subunit